MLHFTISYVTVLNQADVSNQRKCSGHFQHLLVGTAVTTKAYGFVSVSNVGDSYASLKQWETHLPQTEALRT
jgi:hypothetical protein